MADKEELNLRQANPHRAWYVIHTYSGYENKVKANLERLMHSASMSEMIFNVVVPVENEIEVKDGKEKVVPRKVFPGYVLVEMEMNDDTWHLVKNTSKVTPTTMNGSAIRRRPIRRIRLDTSLLLCFCVHVFYDTCAPGRFVARRCVYCRTSDV